MRNYTIRNAAFKRTAYFCCRRFCKENAQRTVCRIGALQNRFPDANGSIEELIDPSARYSQLNRLNEKMASKKRVVFLKNFFGRFVVYAFSKFHPK